MPRERSARARTAWPAWCPAAARSASSRSAAATSHGDCFAPRLFYTRRASADRVCDRSSPVSRSRALAGTLVLAATAIASPVLAEPFPGFKVGLSQGADDVVKNSVPTAAFDPAHHTYKVYEQLSTTFYLESDEANANVDKVNIEADAPIQEDWPIANVSLAKFTGGNVGHTTTPMEVIYNCFKPGILELVITLDVQGFDPIAFSWHAICDEGCIQNYALDVGLAPNTDDIIKAGQVTPTWNPASHTAVVHSGTDKSDFVLSMEGDTTMTLKSIELEQENPFTQPNWPVVNLTVSGFQSGLLSKTPQTLTIHYQCFAKGVSEIAITVYDAECNDSKEAWAWHKECLGAVDPGSEMIEEVIPVRKIAHK